MATGASYRCKFCGRSNFKSSHGYSQHLQTSQCNGPWLREVDGDVDNDLPHELGAEADTADHVALCEQPDAPQKAEANFHDFHQLDPRDMDAVAIEIGGLLDAEEGPEDTESEEDDPESEEDDDFGDGDDDSSGVSDSESGGLPSDSEDEVIASEGPNTWIRDQYKEYARGQVGNTIAFNKEEEASIRLMDVLKLKKSPLNAYKSLMEWHLREKGEIEYYQSLKDCHSYISREVILKKLRDRYNFKNKYPYKRKIKLPVCGTVTHQTLHLAPAVIQGLLTDPRIEDADYLFYDGNPLAPPPDKHTTITDLHTSKAFRHTHRIEITPGERKQLMPLPLYVDGSAISHFHDLELIQVKVSLGFWSRETRTKEYAWGILGYIEKLHTTGGTGRKMWSEAHHMERQDGYDSEDGSSECESMDGIGDDQRQDFHAQLESILEGLVDLIDTGFLWDPKYKGVLYRDVHYIPFVPFIKCDTKEGDDLCGKFQMRSGNVKQLCRYCKVPTEESNDHLHKCTYKTVTEIRKLVEKGDVEGLRLLSQSYLTNAFHKVKFNRGNDRGVHGACPSDMLHAFQLGIFKYLRDVFFEFIGGNPAKLMNGLSGEYCKQFKRQSDKSMPSTSFSKGIKEGKLMGKEFRGVLLNMLVLLHCGTGRSLLRSSRSQWFKTEMQVADWSMLVELLLVWEAYLHSPEMQVRHVKKLEKKHRHIMYLIRKVAPRVKGMGLKLMKFHAILHLQEDIFLYGVPLEFDTSANESHHKPSKQAAVLTQRSHRTFNIQTATRLTEFKLIELAMLELEEDKKVWEYYQGLTEEDDSEVDEMEVSSNENEQFDDQYEVAAPDDTAPMKVETGDTQIWVGLSKEDGMPEFRLGGRSKFKKRTRWSNDLVQFLYDLQELLSEEMGLEHELQIFTSHKRGSQMWRGHPNYRGKGHWRDWAWVDYGADGEFCCHIWCFVAVPPIHGGGRLEYGTTWLEEGTFAVVETSKVGKPLEGERESELLLPLNKDAHIDSAGQVTKKIFALANTSAFTAPACVVADIGGPPNRYYVVEPRDRWGDVFIDWLESGKDDQEDVLGPDNEVVDTDDEED